MTRPTPAEERAAEVARIKAKALSGPIPRRPAIPTVEVPDPNNPGKTMRVKVSDEEEAEIWLRWGKARGI